MRHATTKNESLISVYVSRVSVHTVRVQNKRGKGVSTEQKETNLKGSVYLNYQ